MKAQALGDTSSLEFMRGRRILEINPDHPIIKDLNVSVWYNILSEISCLEKALLIFVFFWYRLLVRMHQRALKQQEWSISCMTLL